MTTHVNTTVADGLTRRGLLGAAGGAMLVAGGLASPPWAGGRGRRETLIEPPRIRSHNGLLRLTLEAERREEHIAGQWREVFLYNGQFPAPTLVADPGDRIAVRLVNRLDEPTNLHTHGFHVSPEGNSDNVLIHIAPGETFEYEFDLPRDHAPGLNWYHPHAHGHGTQQLFGGLAGAIILRSTQERRRRRSPIRDRVLVFTSPDWDADGRLKPWSANLIGSQVRLINGQRNPSIAIRRGETQRWRILNASVSDFLDLKLDGHRLAQIAADGNPWSRPVETDTVHIPPGGRAEVLVTGGRPGSHALRALPSDHGLGFFQPELVLATLESRPGWGPTMSAEPLLAPFCDLRKEPIDRRRTITFTMRGGFRIDGKPFDPDRIDQIVRLGAVEEWTVVNDSPLVHPFHIHVNPFQMTHVDGEPIDEPGHRDTATVHPNRSITFRTRFADFPGKSVFHCHISPHSDLGMMATFNVVPDGAAPPAAEATAAASGAPGALCKL